MCRCVLSVRVLEVCECMHMCCVSVSILVLFRVVVAGLLLLASNEDLNVCSSVCVCVSVCINSCLRIERNEYIFSFFLSCLYVCLCQFMCLHLSCVRTFFHELSQPSKPMHHTHCAETCGARRGQSSRGHCVIIIWCCCF